VVVISLQSSTGSVAAKPGCGSTPLLEKHAEFLLGLITDRPDIAGRDRRGDAQTKDRWQPQRGVAILRSSQYQLQKNVWRAPFASGSTR